VRGRDGDLKDREKPQNLEVAKLVFTHFKFWQGLGKVASCDLKGRHRR
jgi:hypothetical protein